MGIVERSNPNCGPRRGGARPDLVLLHHTAMLTAEAALDRLCDPAAEVSAHYLVAEDGRIWRMVAEEVPGGAAMTVTGSDVERIRALGFIGIMTVGMHHQAHHLAIANGNNPHQH